jgi:hypothetical protein
MKKTKGNLILGMIVTGIVGTTLVKVAEYMFGTVNVFLFAVATTAIVGIVVVPIMQVKRQ